MIQANMTGARLAYVVVPLDGTVERETCKWDAKSKQVIKKMEKQPGGFMVYFPRGHALRMSAEQLKHYRLNDEPSIINMTGLHDPKSPIGKLMRAQDDQQRRSAMFSLEKAVIALATAKSGAILLPEQVREDAEPADAA